MRLPARVEDRVSIVDMCTPMLALRNLEADPVQTVVPLVCPHHLFPIVLPWFRPTPETPAVDLPSQSLAQYQQFRDTVTCLPTHTEQKIVTVAKVQIIRTRNSSIVILLPRKTPTATTNDCGHRKNQRCMIMTNFLLCSEPRACAQTAVRQMMMLVRRG